MIRVLLNGQYSLLTNEQIIRKAKFARPALIINNPWMPSLDKVLDNQIKNNIKVKIHK